MNQVRHPDWDLETARLARVMEEVTTQLETLDASVGRRRGQLMETGRWMFEELPLYATDFDTIVELAQQVDLLRGKQQEYVMTAAQLRRLRRMTDVPYFGRMDFQEHGEAAPEPIYIGIGSLMDSTEGLPLVYDWRAPISSMYYDYSLGDASYIAPAGPVHGQITLKRQYQIRHGQLLSLFDSALHIGDDVLQ
ncbi:MAG: helicase, partial [Alicyclobacillus sp.]|nr:helicase [Alicyclobacillus sp.]